MNATLTTLDTNTEQLQYVHPSFIGLVRGELLKTSRRRSTWVVLALLVLLPLLGFQAIELISTSSKTLIQTQAAAFLARNVFDSMGILRVMSGLYLLVVVAFTIGLEYSMGTIRVLVARGVPKLMLLSAKVASSIIIAVIALILGLVFSAILVSVLLVLDNGSMATWGSLATSFWNAAGIYILTILLNMVVTILVGTVLTVLGRSLAFGLTLSLLYFPVDNIGSSVVLPLISVLTKNDFWRNLANYFLGPNLNAMASQLVGKDSHINPIGSIPPGNISGMYTVWVAVIYAIIFAIIAGFIMWKRDIKE
ncbi:MAG TPA: ABC transporter permease [Dictyobacter sp.]|jgi:ABC-2 type transport system permease protein|nr:ABC transporter permease [Dictyobacter sp.]